MIQAVISVRGAAQHEPEAGREGGEAAHEDAAGLRARRLPLPARGGRTGLRRLPQAGSYIMFYPKLHIGAKLSQLVIVDTKPTQADISCNIFSS